MIFNLSVRAILVSLSVGRHDVDPELTRIKNYGGNGSRKAQGLTSASYAALFHLELPKVYDHMKSCFIPPFITVPQLIKSLIACSFSPSQCIELVL